MTWVVVIHRVDDYGRWRAAFDGAAELRRAAGELSFRVLVADDDAEQVVHLARWTSTADARAFFTSPDVIAIRVAAGVHEPQFHFLKEMGDGDLHG